MSKRAPSSVLRARRKLTREEKIARRQAAKEAGIRMKGPEPKPTNLYREYLKTGLLPEEREIFEGLDINRVDDLIAVLMIRVGRYGLLDLEIQNYMTGKGDLKLRTIYKRLENGPDGLRTVTGLGYRNWAKDLAGTLKQLKMMYEVKVQLDAAGGGLNRAEEAARMNRECFGDGAYEKRIAETPK